MSRSRSLEASDGLSPQSATLIGDVVGSRRHRDRAVLQDTVVEALTRVNERLPGVQALDVTVGDEFQGSYGSLADALLAALLVRLELLPEVDTRYGLGWGSFQVFDTDRRIASQDGPAWWAARAAIERVKEQSARPRSRHLRTWFAVEDESDGGAGSSWDPVPLVNAFLVCRDESIGRMNERGLRLLLGLMSGKTQSAMAEAEGITQSAVSQHLSREGAFAVRAAHETLGGLLK